MQLCSCKHVRSIHTHCLITFATIYDTFIEIVILYAHGALSMGLCMHTYCTGTIHVCNVLSCLKSIMVRGWLKQLGEDHSSVEVTGLTGLQVKVCAYFNSLVDRQQSFAIDV